MTEINSTLRVLLRIAIAMLCLSACAQDHLRGGTSTETGNPPAIESSLVTKSSDGERVHIVGEPGAVSPGSIEVEVTNLATGTTQTAKVAKDGSFDITVSGSPDDAYAVSGVDGKRRSDPVYVVLEVATAGDGKNGTLSCNQRSNLARLQLDQVTGIADRQCKTVADCRFASTYTSCSDCVQISVSTPGAGAIAFVVGAIDQGLCASFEKDGCTIASSCDKSRRMAVCVDGACKDATLGELSCQERIDLAGQQIAAAIDGADRTCTTAADCAYAATGASCHFACSDAVVSKAGMVDIEAAIATIEQDVCGSFVTDGCELAPMRCPPPVRLPVGCAGGVCEPASECPPNAKHVPDWCKACGPAGGCLNGGEPGCAIVCDSDAACAGVGDATYGCSARGVCEALGCR